MRLALTEKIAPTTGQYCPYCEAELPGRVTPTGRVIALACDCEGARQSEQAKAIAVEAAKTAELKTKRQNLMLAKSGVMPVHAQAKADDRLARILKSGRGLYITGGVGVGKTYAASALVLAWCAEGRQAEIITETAFLRRLRSSYETSGETEEKIIRHYSELPLLAFDDLGKSKPSQWALEAIWEIFDKRWGHNLPSIVTTQYTDAELLALWMNQGTGEAILSRLHDGCVLVELSGGSKRGMNGDSQR